MKSIAKRIAIAVVEHNDKFVVGKRPLNVPLAGFSEFPGGKVKPNESFAEAAERECREETGLRVQVHRLLLERFHNYPHGKLHLQFLACVIEPNIDRPTLNGEFRWTPRSELAELNFPEANNDLIRELSCNSLE